ncbi:hypothetical protein [Streptodolium elevatio]|uniref:Secreted protein n=1 Tax=Streptodolium elevatio TaxID=3157996 RepID=A0ABV3DWS2_9ACTN
MRKIRTSRTALSVLATAAAFAALVAPTSVAAADAPGTPETVPTAGVAQGPAPRTSYIHAKAPGPGAWNYQHLDVEGSGLRVDSVHGYLTSTSGPYFPHDICGVDVHIWGVKLGGEPFSVRDRNNNCGLGSLGIKWLLHGQEFQPGSYICTRVTWDPARVPEPLCAHIYE